MAKQVIRKIDTGKTVSTGSLLLAIDAVAGRNKSVQAQLHGHDANARSLIDFGNFKLDVEGTMALREKQAPSKEAILVGAISRAIELLSKNFTISPEDKANVTEILASAQAEAAKADAANLQIANVLGKALAALRENPGNPRAVETFIFDAILLLGARNSGEQGGNARANSVHSPPEAAFGDNGPFG